MYLGEWKDTKKHGKGTLIEQNTMYVGHFKDDMKDGKGVLKDLLSGTSTEGFWMNGVLQTKEK